MSRARDTAPLVKRAVETPGLEENSIGPVRRRVKQAAAPEAVAQPRQSKPPARERRPEVKRGVPEDVRRRFVQVKDEYFFPDGAKAFTDRGDKLTTQSENTELIRSLVAIAEARGWREITVEGTERFRKEAWLAANVAGIHARGYTPTEFEQARLVRRPGKRGERSAEVSPREPANRSSQKRPVKRSSQREAAERDAAPRVRPGNKGRRRSSAAAGRSRSRARAALPGDRGETAGKR